MGQSDCRFESWLEEAIVRDAAAHGTLRFIVETAGYNIISNIRAVAYILSASRSLTQRRRVCAIQPSWVYLFDGLAHEYGFIDRRIHEPGL